MLAMPCVADRLLCPSDGGKRAVGFRRVGCGQFSAPGVIAVGGHVEIRCSGIRLGLRSALCESHPRKKEYGEKQGSREPKETASSRLFFDFFRQSKFSLFRFRDVSSSTPAD